MLKLASFCLILAASAAILAQDPPHHKVNTVDHAAVHASHWIDHHVSAPHHTPVVHHRRRRRRHHKVNTVDHAVVHASHWIDHHVSAPHH